jgi:hypothetical protein
MPMQLAVPLYRTLLQTLLQERPATKHIVLTAKLYAEEQQAEAKKGRKKAEGAAKDGAKAAAQHVCACLEDQYFLKVRNQRVLILF